MKFNTVVQRTIAVTLLLSVLLATLPPVVNGYSTPNAPILTLASSGSGRLTLTWTQPADNGSPITGYNIYRGDSAGTETYFDTVTGAATLTYTNTGLTNGRTYHYFIRAVNNGGEGQPSNEVQGAPMSAPGLPTALTGVPGDGTVSLSWQAPYDDGGQPIVQYRVYRSAVSKSEVFLANTTETSFTDAGLTNGRTYFYQVSAVNGYQEGGRCNETAVLLADVPGAVTGLVATRGNASVVLNWTAPGYTGGSPITGYLIFRGNGSGEETFLWNTVSVTYNDTGLINGQAYFYTVRAANAYGSGPESSEVAATPLTVPNNPTGLQALRADRSAVLSWSAPAVDGGTAILYYRVYRGTTPGGEIFISNATTTAYTDIGLTNGRTYYYKVSAVNGLGEGSRSAGTSVVPVTVPGAPQSFSAVASDGRVALSWSAPGSDGGSSILRYYIYWSLTPDGATTRIDTLTNTTSYQHLGLTNGQTYYYKISASSSVGEGPLSGPVSATPLNTPGAPNALTIVPGAKNITLSWQVPSDGGTPITGYVIYRGTASGTESLLTLIPANSSYADLGLPDNTTYFYRISAINERGEGPRSAEVSARTFDYPGAPLFLIASGGDGQVALSWSDPSYIGGSAVSGYNVYRGESAGNEVQVASLVTSPYTDVGLTNGHTYYYYVRAVNGLGEGAADPEVSATPARVPDPPVLTAAGGLRNVTLSWSAPAFDGGMGISGFAIYRGTAPGQEAFLVSVGDIRSYIDSGLSDGTEYYYRVAALNPMGEGPSSLEAHTSTLGPPGAPSALTATPADGHMYLRWAAPASNGGSPVIGYVVYRGLAAGGETFLRSVTGTSFSDPEPVLGLTYYYTVSAVNGVGEGPACSEAWALTAFAPGAPVGLTAAPAPGQVHLNWTAPASDGGSAVIGYRVYRSTTSGAEALVTTVQGLELSESYLINGQTYYYQVSAVNQVGEGPLSPEVSAVPAMVPGQVTGLTAIPGLRQITLDWTTPATGGSAIGGYNVYRGTTAGDEGTTPVARGVTAPFTDTGLLDATIYYYRVTATNPVGEGPASDEASATTKVTPAPAADLSLTTGDRQLQLSWTAALSGDGSSLTYRLYRSTDPGHEVYLATTAETRYNDTGLTNGQTYYYRVSSVNATGEGARSEEVSGVAMTRPSEPIDLMALTGDGLIALNWNKPVDGGGGPIIGYHLYWSLSSAGPYALIDVNGTAYLHDNRTNGVTYYYKVAAVNRAGEGNLSERISAVPQARPLAIADLSASGEDGRVVLTWTDPNGPSASILGYRIYRGNATGDETAYALSSTATFTDENVTNGQLYYYRVAAINATGEGRPSNEAMAVPLALPNDILSTVGRAWVELVIIGVALLIAIGTGFILVRKGIISMGREPKE